MKSELRSIPPAPRPVRPIALVFRNWPLGVAAVFLCVYGGLVTLMFGVAADTPSGRHSGPARELFAIAPYVTIVPGSIVLLLYFRSVLTRFRLLRHGDVTVAESFRAHRVRMPGPMTFRVEFWFRDHHAEVRTGSHWVRARSRLGEAVHSGERSLLVVHERRRPHRHQLVSIEDFGTTPPGGTP